jgi:DNA-binding response OmpR family regulator
VESYNEFKKYSILIAEDDPIALNSLVNILKRYFKKVLTAINGIEAYETALSQKVDIILTDMRMPHQDGADFVKQLRKLDVNLPVIFMSAHTDSKTLLRIIPLNITDYLVKPIQIDQVLQLCQELFKKKESIVYEQQAAKHLYQLNSGIIVDLARKVVTKEGKMILLTKKEFELLSLLIKNKQSVLSKTQIEYLLWDGEIVSESSVKTLIKKLRSKIGEESIATAKNLGYRICITS